MNFYLLPLQDAGPGYDLIGHLRLSLRSGYARLVGKTGEMKSKLQQSDRKTRSGHGINQIRGLVSCQIIKIHFFWFKFSNF